MEFEIAIKKGNATGLPELKLDQPVNDELD